MFTQDKEKEGEIFVNPIQESPQRLSIYTINRCEDQVIGFEFVSNQYQSNPKCFGNILVNLCVPVETITPIDVVSAIFTATDDPCYKDNLLYKTDCPHIELIKTSNEKLSGVIVRFFEKETCCLPTQLSFKIIGKDKLGSNFSIARGLLVFK